MIDNAIEYLTAKQAIEDGLYDAIKRGETVFSGRYECGKDGKIVFKQNNFVFTDKVGNIRVGRFKDDDAITEFINFIRIGDH